MINQNEALVRLSARVSDAMRRYNSLEKSVSSTVDQIGSNKDGVASNQTSINTHTQQIADAVQETSDLSTALVAYVAALESADSTLGTNLATTDASVSVNTTAISSLETAVTALEAADVVIQAALAQIGTVVDVPTGTVTDITTITNDVGELVFTSSPELITVNSNGTPASGEQGMTVVFNSQAGNSAGAGGVLSYGPLTRWMEITDVAAALITPAEFDSGILSFNSNLSYQMPTRADMNDYYPLWPNVGGRDIWLYNRSGSVLTLTNASNGTFTCEGGYELAIDSRVKASIAKISSGNWRLVVNGVPP
jgi:hypothetical protein